MNDLLATLADALAALLVLAGALFSLIGAIGILKLQDVLIRMHASSKAGVFGSSLILLAVAVVYGDQGSIVVQALLAILFLLITAPVAAHVIGRHAYRAGIPLWPGTWADELAQPPLPGAPGGPVVPPGAPAAAPSDAAPAAGADTDRADRLS